MNRKSSVPRSSAPHRASRMAALAVGTFSVLAACGDLEPVGPSAEHGPQPAHAVVGRTRLVEGETGPGAQYAFHLPDAWNGSLVLYIHGIRDADAPVDLHGGNQDDIIGLSAQLADLGYAVGYSSFSENGWAVRDGAIRTHQLRELFAGRFGQPARVYLVGHSMGALIAINLAESFPQHYAGVLPVCGVLGGAPLTIDYIGNVRLLFDYFYPGVLPGSVVDPAGATLEQVVGAAQAAMLADLTGAFTLAGIMGAIGMPLPLAGSTLPEQVPSLVGTVLYALGFHVRGFDDLNRRTHGHPAFDNSTTNYVVPAVQASIPRYSARPDGREYLRKWYEPTGQLRIPTLALDPMFDPIAPLFHKAAYDAAVATHGEPGMFARRAIPTFGHCNVPTAVTIAAFTDLVGWVEAGTVP